MYLVLHKSPFGKCSQKKKMFRFGIYGERPTQRIHAIPGVDKNIKMKRFARAVTTGVRRKLTIERTFFRSSPLLSGFLARPPSHGGVAGVYYRLGREKDPAVFLRERRTSSPRGFAAPVFARSCSKHGVVNLSVPPALGSSGSTAESLIHCLLEWSRSGVGDSVSPFRGLGLLSARRCGSSAL